MQFACFNQAGAFVNRFDNQDVKNNDFGRPFIFAIKKTGYGSLPQAASRSCPAQAEGAV